MYVFVHWEGINPFFNTKPPSLSKPIFFIFCRNQRWIKCIKNVECGLTGAVCCLIKCHFWAKSEPAGNGHFSSINSDRWIFFYWKREALTACCKFSWENTSPQYPATSVSESDFLQFCWKHCPCRVQNLRRSASLSFEVHFEFYQTSYQHPMNSGSL